MESPKRPFKHFVECVVPSLSGVCPRFDRWCGRSKNRQTIGHLCQSDRDIATVVSRCRILLVGLIVFLIDDDEAKSLVLQWCKHGASGSQHDVDLVVDDLGPLLVSLGIGESRMQDGDPAIREPARESTARLRCQGDFRHEHHRDLSTLDRLFDQANVDLGLARSCDSTNQMHVESIIHVGRDVVDDRLLKRRGCRGGARLRRRLSPGRFDGGMSRFVEMPRRHEPIDRSAGLESAQGRQLASFDGAFCRRKLLR